MSGSLGCGRRTVKPSGRNTMRVLLVCLLAACSTNNNDPMGDDAPPTDAPPSSGNVTPQTGAWFYDEVTPVSSTCPANISNGTGAFGIDSASSSSFRVIPNDGTPSFTCTLAGKAFDCPTRAAATEDYRPGFDAVVTVNALANGTFANSTQASGRQEATVSCAGTQCAATGATFPCTIKVDFVIRAR